MLNFAFARSPKPFKSIHKLAKDSTAFIRSNMPIYISLKQMVTFTENTPPIFIANDPTTGTPQQPPSAEDVEVLLDLQGSSNTPSNNNNNNNSDNASSSSSTTVDNNTNVNSRYNYDIVLGTSYLPKKDIMRGNFNTREAPVVKLQGVLRPDCGEDAFFRTTSPSFSTFGVADGVGGWNALGINPALFAWELMENSQMITSTKSVPYPWEILEEAFDKLKADGNVQAGSSTACIVSLDKRNGIIHSANLGDSAYVVIRFSMDTTGEGSEQPSLKFEIAHQTKVLQHYFNAPYQMAVLPKGISATQKMNYMNDSPKVAHKETQGPLQSGDIIVMATDGLFDNLFVEETCQVLVEELSDFYQELFSSNNLDLFSLGTRTALEERLQAATAQIVEKAAHRSVSDMLTPFSKEARVNGWDDCTGGKMDDITVITGVVISKEYEHPVALL